MEERLAKQSTSDTSWKNGALGAQNCLVFWPLSSCLCPTLDNEHRNMRCFGMLQNSGVAWSTGLNMPYRMCSPRCTQYTNKHVHTLVTLSLSTNPSKVCLATHVLCSGPSFLPYKPFLLLLNHQCKHYIKCILLSQVCNNPRFVSSIVLAYTSYP